MSLKSMILCCSHVLNDHARCWLLTERRQDPLGSNPDLTAGVGHRGDPHVRQLGNLHLPHQHPHLYEGSAQVRHQKRGLGFGL